MNLLDRIKTPFRKPSLPIPPGAVAIVIPWFGEDLKGGAEQLAWQVATRLVARGHPVEVLTTCCRSFLDDWAGNHWPSGATCEAGLTVRRFPVDARNRLAFDALNQQLLEQPPDRFLPGVSPVAPDEAVVWIRDNINSQALEHYLNQRRNDYSSFVFLPYLYGVILNGLPLVADCAALQPCLHDEAYAYLPAIATLFHKAHRLLFNSAGEQALAARLYGPAMLAKGIVTGSGIECADLDTLQLERLPAELRDQPFVLYLGRRDSTKNTDLLVEAYARFRDQYPASRLRLVLAGPGHTHYAGRAPELLDLGLVEAPVKAALLHHCLALAQPSVNESFSRVMFEAWHCGKPVAAHRDCLATALAVTDASGGWTVGTREEWSAWLAHVAQIDPAELSCLGQRGRAYALDQADWEPVMERYEQLLYLAPSITSTAAERGVIHQLLPNLSYGDAISNHALAIRDRLRAQGYSSEIFVRHVDPRVAQQCRVFQDGLIPAAAGLLYHHSIGSEITPAAMAHPGPKCLIYHNITPAEFFEPWRPDFAGLLRQGRRDMYDLASSFPLSVGVSAFNAGELATFGFRDPGVLPIAIDPGKWDFPADEALMQELQDGRTNLLFVGRLSPNKRQDQLTEAFTCYLRFDPTARLILVGDGGPFDPYVEHLHALLRQPGLRGRVILTGHVNDAQLAAYYRTAHLFWSMSEHEGFCVPLIEAMWFDVPILAYKSSAVPETLATAGLLLTTKDQLSEVAAVVKLLVHDSTLRDAVLKAQRQRRQDFLPERIWPALDRIVAALCDPAACTAGFS
jgi:glycosyltransferase involved in cell wall biosynthesis